MAKPRVIKQDFEHARNLAYIRSRAQARYRREIWQLTYEDFCAFWNTPELFAQRGRSLTSLVLSKKDYDQPWTSQNCHIIPRLQQLRELHVKRPSIHARF